MVVASMLYKGFLKPKAMALSFGNMLKKCVEKTFIKRCISLLICIGYRRPFYVPSNPKVV